VELCGSDGEYGSGKRIDCYVWFVAHLPDSQLIEIEVDVLVL
jgi:hypothetical protein